MKPHLKRFNYLHGSLDGVYHEAGRLLGVTDSVMSVLYTIRFFGDGCPQSAVYKLFGASRQTVNSAIRKLAKEGYLFLEPGSGRGTRMYLSESGKALSARTAETLISMENAVFDSWEASEVETYLALTEKYLHDFKKAVKALPERSKTE